MKSADVIVKGLAPVKTRGFDPLAPEREAKQQELNAKLSARSFDCANDNVCPRVGRVPEDSHSGKARENFSEQR